LFDAHFGKSEMNRYSLRLLCLALTLFVGNLQAFAQATKNAPAAQKAQADTKAAQKPPVVPKAVASPLKLARLATDESIFFATTNGWQSPAPGTTNKTEKLWAEPSVQEFIQLLGDEIKSTIEKQDPDAADKFGSVLVLIEAAFKHPMAFQLLGFTVEENPTINLEVVIDLESDAERVKGLIDELIKLAPTPPLTEEIEGVTFSHPPIPEDRAGVMPRWGMYKSYLIFTLGQKTTAATVARLKSNAAGPAWLSAILRDLNVERPTAVMQLDMRPIWTIVEPLIDQPSIRAGLKASGVMGIKRFAAVTGLDANGTVERSMIETDGAPQGLVALLPDKPLTPEDLKGIPAKPAQANIIRFDLAETVEAILKVADAVEPNARIQFDQLSDQGEQILGFSIKNDLIKSFGDVWMSYVSASEPGSGLVPSVVLVANLRDSEKMLSIQEKLAGLIKQEMERQGQQAPVTLHEFNSRGAKGYRLQINSFPLPVTPTWAISKDQLIISVTPQLVTAHVSASAKPPAFAANEHVKTAFQQNPKLVMLSYRDPVHEIQGLYALVTMFSPMALGQLQAQGIEFDLPPLPPFGDIEQHLAPSVTTLSREAMGYRSESHSVIPSMSASSPAVIAVAASLLVPAVFRAQGAAQRTQSMNNMKQIGLAMFNFESTFGRFPKRTIDGDDGKPKLSWRVAILPYIEQQELYSQFHLDEPWDSPHNKELIAKMPATYARPGTDPTKGLTPYMVLDADGALFDDDDGPKIADVTDGTSNTIMTVETDEDHMVIWTKPEDLEVDFDDILAGLEGAWEGGFLVGLADGSARFISDAIDLEVFKSLLTRAGGEVVGPF
jgi:hypothetical protein